MLGRLIAAIWVALGVAMMPLLFGPLFAGPSFVLALALAVGPRSVVVLTASLVFGGLLAVQSWDVVIAAADHPSLLLQVPIMVLAATATGLSALALYRRRPARPTTSSA